MNTDNVENVKNTDNLEITMNTDNTNSNTDINNDDSETMQIEEVNPENNNTTIDIKELNPPLTTTTTATTTTNIDTSINKDLLVEVILKLILDDDLSFPKWVGNNFNNYRLKGNKVISPPEDMIYTLKHISIPIGNYYHLNIIIYNSNLYY